MPSGTDIREVFICSNGKMFIGIDYSQIELRIAGYTSKDTVMITAFKEDHDLHTIMAQKFYNKKNISKEERKFAKILNFSLLYGLGAPGLVRNAKTQGKDLTLNEAKKAVNAFRALYYGYTAWQKRQREACGRVMRVSSRMGKRRKLGENFIYTCSVNHPIQAGAAEVMLTALILTHSKFKDTSTKILACVHDELLIECDRDKVEHTKKILINCLEKAMLKIYPEATLNNLVDVKVGKTWADVH